MKLPLTISLLASNRIASLERCLDSLKPLLQNLPAELIIVFTGSDERVRQVAASYTDQIIPFTWCNDFSAARNEGLKHAKGEWFLYLDDDEWFDDVTELCDFFLSGEYKRYRFASYIQRNYLDWSCSRYSDFSAIRMAENTEELSFRNPIHEELFPFNGPCKVFHSYVHHYGYLKDKSSKNTGKSDRNIPLLLKAINEQPDFTRNYVQLAQEYFVTQKWEQAEELCRQGLLICTKAEFKYRNWLQSYLVETLYKKGDHGQAEKEALLILEKEKPCELVCLVLYLMLISIYEEKELFEKALRYGEDFENLLNYMEQNPELWIEQRVGTVNRDKVMNPNWLYPARLNSIRAALELSAHQKAEYFLNLLPWDDEFAIEAYYPLLDQWKEDYSSLLPQLLTSLPYDSPYLLMQRFLCDEDPFLFRRCLKEIKNPYLRQQLIKKALRTGYEFSILLERMDLETWKTCIAGIITHTPFEELQYLWEAEKQISADYSLQGLWFKKLLLEKVLFCGFLMKRELLMKLEEYALCIQTYYRELYREVLFDEGLRHLLPADCRVSFVILKALEYWKQGNLTETLRLLRTALQIDPQMTGVVREVMRIINNEMMHPAPAAGPEFEQLAIQMKSALKTMLDNRQYTEAMQVLSQLIPLLPNDIELIKLQQQLLEKTH